MSFSVLTVVTVTISLMGGLLWSLGRIRKSRVEDVRRQTGPLPPAG